jgi:hypothetical protein
MTWLQDLVRSIYAGRRFVCGAEVLMESAWTAKRLVDRGAEAIAVAATRGTGELPEGIDTRCLDLGPVASMMEGIRRSEVAMAHLDGAVLTWIDAFDPDRRARGVLPFFTTSSSLAGRASWGARQAAWMALEDKTTIDALWDALGVPHAPVRVVPLRRSDVEAAHAALDRGSGTVVAADARSGWHGGAEFTRWAHDRDDLRAIVTEFLAVSDRVRVMPFLEGVPCSIHGIVFPDYVVVLRPCEMMVLRDRGTREFRYAQAATYWDPPPADRDAMRAAARRVGEALSRDHGYRGAFTIDGVMTADGFRPTELNPRMGAALAVMSRAWDAVPISLVNLAIVEGVAVDWRPRDLEVELLSAADQVRAAGGMAVVKRPLAPGKRWYSRVDGRWVPGTEADRTVEVEVGPHAAGAILFLRWNPAALVVGEPVAPVACSLLLQLDRELSLGLGAIEAAPDVRR